MAQVVFNPVDTNERAGITINLPVAAAIRLYPGTLGAKDANGNATFASDVAGLTVIGRVEDDVDNTQGAAGAAVVNLKRGVFSLTNSATNPLAVANIGQLCFVQDEQTVCVAAGSVNQVKAGIFLGFDPDTGKAWVDTRMDESIVPSADTLTALAFTTPTAAEVTAFKNAVIAILKAQGLII